jgi:hypothetical protein
VQVPVHLWHQSLFQLFYNIFLQCEAYICGEMQFYVFACKGVHLDENIKKMKKDKKKKKVTNCPDMG